MENEDELTIPSFEAKEDVVEYVEESTRRVWEIGKKVGLRHRSDDFAIRGLIKQFSEQ